MEMPDNDPRARCVRFGPFVLDSRSGELRKHGSRLHLAEQPFQLLAFLVERPGEVATREEIRHRLWPGDTFVDFDNGLNATINRVREALGDSAEKPRFIETLPKRGYRFIAPVGAVPERPDREPAMISEPVIPPAAPSRRGILWVGIFSAAVLLAALTLWIGHLLRPARAVKPPARTMLVVLPFVNLSGDPSQDYFTEGLTEEMITQLGGLNPERLGVIARTSSMHYKGSTERAGQIGRELGVDYLLEGSFRREDSRVRISAQLIRVRDETHLWARDYDRDWRDYLAVEDEIARSIAGQIEQQLAALPSAAPPRIRNPQAHEDYLKGRYFWNLRTEPGHRKAIEYFEQAIAEEPDNARAYSGLADAYALLGSNPTWAITRKEAMKRARAAARKALALDDTLAEAHTSAAFISWHYDWDWPAAEKEFRRALELNPSYSTAHHWFAYYLMSQGRAAAALDEIHRAQETDPLSLITNTDAAEMLLFARQVDPAIEQARKVLEMDPNFLLARMVLARAYAQKQQLAEALQVLTGTVGTDADNLYLKALLAVTYALAGERAQAEDLLRQLTMQSEKRHTEELWMGIALAYALLGEKDEAFRWLDKSYQARDGSLTLIQVLPTFDPLRSDPRFADLVRRIGLPP
jgi:TolB-like protein/DNA-binding winged helix-turn-helix (wHTH) protein/Tfp pilus assembly protein PilF